MWQSNAAPVGTPHAVNASPSYSLTSNGPGALRASAKAHEAAVTDESLPETEIVAWEGNPPS
jgi:hypothetical protein